MKTMIIALAAFAFIAAPAMAGCGPLLKGCQTSSGHDGSGSRPNNHP